MIRKGGMSSDVLEDLLKKDIHEDTWEWWKSHLYLLREDQDFFEAEAVFKEFSMYKSRPC